MTVHSRISTWRDAHPRYLLGVYTRFALWYLLAIIVLAILGVEAIRGHVTPFYALFLPCTPHPGAILFALSLAYPSYVLYRQVVAGEPAAPHSWRKIAALVLSLLLAAAAFMSPAIPIITGAPVFTGANLSRGAALVHVMLPLVIFWIALALWRRHTERLDWFHREPDSRETKRILLSVMAFAFLFACAVAMMRGGSGAISGPYERASLEYAGDIGAGGSIRGLLREYNHMHPYLSIHAKVHPPGPIVLLWVMSWFVLGREPMALSLATAALASLALVPLYFLAKDILGKRAALWCVLLYALVPSVTLFTATSADILFTPFTLGTLFLFWRALHRHSVLYAAMAGVGYAAMSFLSFSLLGVGAFFGWVGLWRLRNPEHRRSVYITAVVMGSMFLLTHMGVRWWSGFDVIECFKLCKGQFDADQAALQVMDPRYASWAWKFLNPWCWMWFAGIPVTLLCLWRWLRPAGGETGFFVICGLTFIALDLLYLARGEGERSALYVFPFLVLPAASMLDELGRRSRSLAVPAVTFAFLAAQTWITEALFYTYW